LKLQYDKMLSNFAFKFNLRRYSQATICECMRYVEEVDGTPEQTPSLIASLLFTVGRCRLPVSNPRVESAHGISA